MKLLVYPMNKSLAPLGRYGDMVKSCEQVIPVAPRSFGYGTGDIAVVDGGTECGVKITYDLDAALTDCTDVFVDYYPAVNLSAVQYMDTLKKAANAPKNLFISGSLWDFLLKEGCKDVEKLPLHILDYQKDNIILNNEKRLLELPAPCIFVFGAGDLTNKFDIQLGLRKVFQRRGYNVTQLGTKSYSSLFGFDPLPQFIFEPGDSQKKVMDFNHYVYEKAKSEHADVIIIGVPGGIMPNNPYEFTGFGEMAFLMGSALKADAAILSLYCAAYPEDTLQYLIDICKYRFNAPVHYVNLACNDMMISTETLEFQTLSVPVSHVTSEILPQVTCLRTNVFAIMDPSGMEELGQKILKELESNL